MQIHNRSASVCAYAALGEVHRRQGNLLAARAFFERAADADIAHNEFEQQFLNSKETDHALQVSYIKRQQSLLKESVNPWARVCAWGCN